MFLRTSAFAVATCVLLACEPAEPVRAPETPTPSKTPAEPTLPLAFDPGVRKGTLDNGLSYYIVSNKKPEKRAQMWLAVNAGSVLEDEDQRGLAHFVEHMAFNGTRRFPKNEIIDFLERSGIRFGADLNAYTTFDETVYKLQVPTDRPELVDRGLMVLRDFSDGVTFDAVEVEKERSVVLEEWRLRRGVGARLNDKHESEAAHPSRYMTHLPIGKMEIIKAAPPATLARFYHDWYRPDLMAIVVVGDVVPVDVETKLRREFASLKAPSSERARTSERIGYSDKMSMSIETDPEQSQTRVGIASAMAHRPLRSTSDFRRVLVEQLWNTMLNGRFDEIARRSDAPFLSAAATTAHPTRPTDVFRQNAVVKEENVQESLAALFREVIRVEKHGFTASELERAKAQLVRGTERRGAGADRRDAAQLATQLVHAFTQDEPLPSPAAELALVKRFAPTLALADVNKVSAALVHGRQISIAGPPSMVKPTEDSVRSTLRAVLTSTIAPYDDLGPATALMPRRPTPGVVVETKTIPEIGVTEWTMQNGAKVVVKPTTTGDTIRMVALSPGGTSLASDADFESARFAADIVSQGGLGPLDETQLRHSLAGKVVQLHLDLKELSEGMNASAAEDDLETMMQMVHLAFVAPRRDERAFAAWRTRQIEGLKHRQLSPETAFAEEMAIFSTQNNVRRRPSTEDTFRRVDLDKAFAFYKDRYGDSGDFTFVFVGNIDLSRFKPIAETYLGSLPSQGRREAWRDPNVSMPAGVQTKTIVNGTEPRSRVSLTFHGTDTWSHAASYDIQFLTDVLRIRLRELLREDMGGIYAVDVSGSLARIPRQDFATRVTFVCAPENVDKLVKAVLDETKRLADKPIADDYIARVREIRRRARETAVTDDTSWLRQLEYVYTYGDDPKSLAGGAGSDPGKMTAERLRAAAKKYLDPREYMLGVLKPRTR